MLTKHAAKTAQLQSTYMNNGRLVMMDLEANGAVIHLIDEVLDVPEGTIYAVSRNPEYPLSTFADYVDKVQLNSSLDRASKNYNVASDKIGNGVKTVPTGRRQDMAQLSFPRSI